MSDMNVKDWLPAEIQSSGIERRFVAGQMLFDQGDATVGVYEVVSGKVRQVRVDPEGRDVVVGIAGPGEMIAEASLFSGTHDCAARAVTNAVVRLHRKATLLAHWSAIRRPPFRSWQRSWRKFSAYEFALSAAAFCPREIAFVTI